MTLFPVGRLYINKTSPSWDELEKNQKDLQPGGRFSPRNCVALYRVAVIVPYRDRDAHLRVFLNHMHPILQRQQLDYGIFIIEQVSFFFLYIHFSAVQLYLEQMSYVICDMLYWTFI